ncbi:MAG TPA: penicillin-binding transpeptidase domain-containing protein, partial [Chlamydiales bacterium]|nr:penicillin-binding transpeptidase domain-containing protein [Chlamydiales bacterium]
MKYIFIFLSFVCLSVNSVSLEVELTAKSAILMNAKTGAILYAKEAQSKIFPASVTKIATALFVLEENRLDLNRVVTVSAEALRQKPNNATEPAHWITADSSLMGLVKGAQIDGEGLLHGLLMCSGNDAANVIGEQ